jgi:hypothetical protein
MADLTKSRADLIRQVLANLGKLGNDEPSDEDSAKVDFVIDPTVSLLSELDIYTAQDVGEVGPVDGSIEPAAFLPLAHYIANAAAASFNMANDSTLIGLAAQAEAQLMIISAPARTLRTLRVDRGVLTRRRYGLYNGSFS